MEIKEIITIGFIGLNALFTFLVYKWQKKQIEIQDTTISALKSYNEIFDIKKVKDFVAMKEETKDYCFL